MEAHSNTARPSTGLTRLFLWQLGATLFVVGFPVFVASGETDKYFAWTIEPPLTAAFLGANYWGSMVLALLCARERLWAAARVAVPGIFVAGSLLLLATLLHLDRFAMETVRGWLWLVLYAGLPPAVVMVVAMQRRVPGGEPPRVAPLGTPVRLVLLAQAAVLLGLGTVLFVAPGETASLWPWALSDLTARAIAAWMLAVATTILVSTRENDWTRLTGPMVGYAAIAVLQLVALARYPDTPDWDDASAWVYLAFLIGMLAVGVYGAAASVASKRPAPTSAAAGIPS
jgi:hypothetical protein